RSSTPSAFCPRGRGASSFSIRSRRFYRTSAASFSTRTRARTGSRLRRPSTRRRVASFRSRSHSSCSQSGTGSSSERSRGLPNGFESAAASTAVEVDGVWKAFTLPHERRTTLKEHFLHPFSGRSSEEQLALQDVSFSVARGEFFGVIGPNGSGKSTLLKIIAGIYRQDRGTVSVHGQLSPFIELGVGF